MAGGAPGAGLGDGGNRARRRVFFAKAKIENARASARYRRVKPGDCSRQIGHVPAHEARWGGLFGLADEVKELLGIVTEYKTAVHVELTRKSIPAGTDNKRQLELAAYLTMTNVQPSHLLLCLNLAMSLAFKLKNFINAASFARRLLELGASAGNAQLLTKAKKVLQLSEAEGRNAISIDFDEMNPYKLCCASLTPIYRGSPVITSPYCPAAYKPEFKGSVCRIDGMSVVGVETVGLVSMPASSSRRG